MRRNERNGPCGAICLCALYNSCMPLFDAKARQKLNKSVTSFSVALAFVAFYLSTRKSQGKTASWTGRPPPSHKEPRESHFRCLTISFSRSHGINRMRHDESRVLEGSFACARCVRNSQRLENSSKPRMQPAAMEAAVLMEQLRNTQNKSGEFGRRLPRSSRVKADEPSSSESSCGSFVIIWQSKRTVQPYLNQTVT